MSRARGGRNYCHSRIGFLWPFQLCGFQLPASFLLIGLVVSIQQTFLRPKHMKDFGLVPEGLKDEDEILVLKEELGH